jgi:hypothetical protein
MRQLGEAAQRGRNAFQGGLHGAGACDGTIVPPAPEPVVAAPVAAVDRIVSSSLPDDDDVPWLPSDYLQDVPFTEGLSCDR